MMPEQPATLAAALVELQSRLPRITKTDRAQAGNRQTSYANLSTITEAVFPLLTECRCTWTCLPTMNDGQFGLLYALHHEPSGEKLEGFYPLPSSNPQTIGGAITYARRYALCAVLGIAPAEDDDSASEGQRAAAERQQIRTRAIGDEFATAPPPHTRLADRARNTADEQTVWTTP